MDKFSRREWLAQAPLIGAAAAQTGSSAKPNIIVIISDQFRGDCIGAMGLNPMSLTPNRMTNPRRAGAGAARRWRRFSQSDGRMSAARDMGQNTLDVGKPSAVAPA